MAWQACQSEVLQGRRRLNYYFIYNLFFWSIQLFSHKSQLNNCLIFTFASCIIFGNYPQFSPLTQQFGPKNGVDVTFSRKLYSLHSTPIHLLVRTVKVITGYCCYRDNYGIVDSVKEWLFRRVLNQYLIIISAEEQLKPAIPR